jgi:adenylate cyclase
MVRGTFEVHEGELVVARNDLEQAIKLYDPKDHHIYVSRSSVDPGVNSHSRLSWTLLFLGYPRQALDEGQKSLALARQLDHANSRGLACDFAAILSQLCGADEAVHEQVETAMVIATEHDLRQWKTIAAILRGWYIACVGQSGEGIAQMQQGLSVYRASGTNLYQEWFLALLAEAYRKHGHSIQGLAMITEALTLVLRDEGFHCWDPELHRLKGVLLLQLSSDNQAEAETCFHHALESARTQQAKSFELRTATSLARLWQQQGKRQEAQDLLAPVYDWFTEGFDTADLQDAKALLDALAEERS